MNVKFVLKCRGDYINDYFLVRNHVKLYMDNATINP